LYWAPTRGYGGFSLNDLRVGRVISIGEIIDRGNVIVVVEFTVILTCSWGSRLASNVFMVNGYNIYCAARG